MVDRVLSASSSKSDRPQVAIIDGFSEQPTTRLTCCIFYEKKYMLEKDGEFYDLSNLTMLFLFCCCLSVTLAEKEQMMIRRKKRNKRVDLFRRSVWPLWHNTLEKRHTWIVYLEDRASWCNKYGHCKAAWNKTPSHFTAAATVLHRELCGAGLIPNTFFLYLLPPQEPAQIATVLIPAKSSGK